MDKRRALILFFAAGLAIAGGVAMAIARYPSDFDWMYTVLSHLASNRRNPEGGRWASGALVVAVILLWPVAGYLDRNLARKGKRRLGVSVCLRAGMASCAIIGFEEFLGVRFSDRIRKGHEAIALLSFFGFYIGLLGHYVYRIRDNAALLAPAILAIAPLCAVGVVQLLLYFDQRDLGWVGADWREMGIPFWLSFAFWQWLAVGFLALALGCLIAFDSPRGLRQRKI